MIFHGARIFSPSADCMATKKMTSAKRKELFTDNNGANTAQELPRKRHKFEDTPSRKDANIVKRLPRPREEALPFPRGGASVLTPLEQKQVQIQAKNDLLFELGSSGGKSARKTAAVHNTKRRASVVSNVRPNVSISEGDTVRPEGLNFKVSRRLCEAL
jgi:hypothetical protein